MIESFNADKFSSLNSLMLFKSNKLISFFKFSVLFDDKLLLLFFSFDLNLNFFFGINKHSFDDISDINILDIISSVNSSIFIFCGVIIFLDFFSSEIFSGSNSGILSFFYISIINIINKLKNY